MNLAARLLPLLAHRLPSRALHQRGERVTAEPCLRHEVRGRGKHQAQSLLLPLTLTLSPQAGRGNPRSICGDGVP